MEDELCGLCATVWMCLGFFLLHATCGTSPVAAEIVEGEGGGDGRGRHSTLTSTDLYQPKYSNAK